jgi:hypothetical protein
MSLHNIWKESVPRERKRRSDGMSLPPEKLGAVERIRTFTVLLPPAPQAGASASSATTAKKTFSPAGVLFGPPLEERPTALLLIVLQTAAKSIKTLDVHCTRSATRSERFVGLQLTASGLTPEESSPVPLA